jgi:spectrin alpha
MTEIEAKKGSVKAFTAFGKQLIAQSHYDSVNIKEKLESLNSDVAAIDKAWLNRRTKLEQCLNLQQFNHDAEQAKRWMAKREAFLYSEEMKVGISYDMVETLLKKHEDFEKSLQAQESKIADIQKFADTLVQGRHYAAVEIAERRALVLSSWAKLKKALIDWRSRLGQSQSLHNFNREVDEMDAWIADKLHVAMDESYRDPNNLEGKLQKHNAFEAEIASNEDRIISISQIGKDLIESQQCPDQENEIKDRTNSLEEQWARLKEKSLEKTQKLKEANQEQQFTEGIKDLYFWCQEVEAKLAADDLGSDMASVELLLKKHHILAADIKAHNDHIKNLKSQSKKLVEAHHFDAMNIQKKQKDIEMHYDRIQELAKTREGKLQESLVLQKFFTSINAEEAWIKEKKLIVGSTDYAKDLFGVKKLIKNHEQLENELNAHEQSLKELLSQKDKLASSDHFAQKEITSKCSHLQNEWQDLNAVSSMRLKKLNESLAYHEFCAQVTEEESWLSERSSLLISDDYGDSFAAVQELLKKHEAFEMDLSVHQGRINEMEQDGQQLIKQENFQSKKIEQRIKQLKQKLMDLENAGVKRKNGLNDSNSCHQFYWEADTVESWIKNKQGQLHLDDYGRDMDSVQLLLAKHQSFKAVLASYKKDGIDNLTQLKESLPSASHIQLRTIQQRYNDIMRRWEKLQKDSDNHNTRLQRGLEQFKKVEELFHQFSMKASSFNTSLSNIEEDLSDAVRCNSLDEIQSLQSSYQQLQQQLTHCKNDLKQIQTLDRQIKSYGTSSCNPYTWFTYENLDENLQHVQKLMKEREMELTSELRRQQENEDLRKNFAKNANSFHSWLTETRTALVDSSGTLEMQLDSVKVVTT